MNPEELSPLETEVLRLLHKGRKLEAVKLYKQQRGVSLLEAKNAVEALEAGGAEPAAEAIDPGELETEIAMMLRDGTKLDAVKRYKQQTGCSLAEAKRAIEAIAAQRGIVAEDAAGCSTGLAMVVLLAIVAAVAAAWMLWGGS